MLYRISILMQVEAMNSAATKSPVVMEEVLEAERLLPPQQLVVLEGLLDANCKPQTPNPPKPPKPMWHALLGKLEFLCLEKESSV